MPNSVTDCTTDCVTGSRTEGVTDGMNDGVADGDTSWCSSLEPTKEKFTFVLFSKLKCIFNWQLLFTVF